MTDTTEQQTLRKRGLNFAYFIIAWDTIEGIVAVTAGILAGSIALIGFGIDSGIEVFAAAVAIWHLKGGAEGKMKLPLRLIALSFFALAVYVGYQSITDLVTQDRPEASLVGIILNAVALVVMVPLAIKQKRTGKALKNKVLIAQADETWLSNYLSISLLVGLGLNALFGWWWADPIVALLLAGVAVWEGWEAWEESSEEDED